ncbi:MAG: hypothetical protein H6710_01630 [Myxococcales bacterium]|nr:hypothetical protein [Myxococcales bacterium]
MPLRPAILAALLLASPTASWAALGPGAQGQPDAEGRRRVLLHARGVPAEAIADALALRAPDLDVVVASDRDAIRDAPSIPLVIVRPGPEGHAITVVLSDGRAFDRHVPEDSTQGPRVIASALANLLAAIAEERVSADRRAVSAASELEAAGEPAEGLELGDGLEPAEPEPEPAPEPEPEPEPAPEPEPEPEPEPAPAPAPTWTLGPELVPLALLLPGAASESGVLGGGGLLVAATARSPRGARVGVDLRALWRGREELVLHRYRVAVHGGYELTRGRLALTGDAFFGVEPWLLRKEGERVGLGAAGTSDPRRTALAIGLRLSPALDLAVGRERDAHLRLGGWLELGYAGVIDNGLSGVRLSLPGDDGSSATPIFRVGGVELSVGLALALRLGLRRR